MLVENQVIDDIVKKIESGQYRECDKLPSENELADQFRVPRITIRKAYEQLEQRGYTYSIQGKGRYVLPRPMPIELILTGSESFTKKMKEKGYDLISENLGCVKIAYDPKIYGFLAVGKEANVYRITRKRILENRPVALHISYLSDAIFPRIEEEGDGILSVFEYYKAQGITHFQDEPSTLRLCYGSEKERIWLACLANMPLITIEGKCRDLATGYVLEYTQIKYRSDCFVYKIGGDAVC
ncbi:MAG: GntR family transcriptional regulator [Cellulosilyticaceae bacterium]